MDDVGRRREGTGAARRPARGAIVETPLAAANLVPPRPKFAALANTKLIGAGVTMPTWQDALARYVAGRAEAAC